MARKATVKKPPNKIVQFQQRRPPPPEHVAQLLDQYVEWAHPKCKPFHGALRNVPPAEVPLLDSALLTTYGPGVKSWRQFRDGAALYDMEFIASDLQHRPRKPWDYCGATIVFEDMLEKEAQAMVEAQRFAPGDAVAFNYDGQRRHGLVVSANEKRVTVVVHKVGKLYVPGKDMVIDDE